MISCVKESDNLKYTINTKKLLDKSGDGNHKLLQQFLPALTNWDRIVKSFDDSNAN